MTATKGVFIDLEKAMSHWVEKQFSLQVCQYSAK